MPYIPHTSEDTAAMMSTIGIKKIDELFTEIPPSMHPQSFNLPEGLSEQEVCSKLGEVASRNIAPKASFLGGGVYNHSIPAAVDAITSRGEFYTAYTPYQPEASQGTLQAIFEYQTSMCRLFDMDIANASVYDGGSTLLEAIMMASRMTKRNVIIIDENVNPLYRTMLATITANLSLDLKTIPLSAQGYSDSKTLFEKLDSTVAALVLQVPSFTGSITDSTDLIKKCHDVGALAIMGANPVMASVLKTPRAMGADIVVAEGQALGLPMNFGGPYLGIMACTKQLVRQMPGRIVGKTKDTKGKEGYVLTLQAREQHIRRAKATSNICSNQALCALRALVHVTLLGPEGLVRTASLSMQRAREAADALCALPGVSMLNDLPFGYEFAITLPQPASEVVEKLGAKGIAAGLPLGEWYKGLENALLVACTEKTTPHDIQLLAQAMGEVL